MKILDLSFQPQVLAEMKYTKFHEVILPRVVFWPLIAACSIFVRYPDGNFKPEYIIPQYLFQIASSNLNFDGIKYFSTKIEYGRPLNVNYAIKVKQLAEIGQCNWLRQQFEMTSPILWAEIDTSNYRKLRKKNGSLLEYTKTYFKTIEQKLEKLQVKSNDCFD